MGTWQRQGVAVLVHASIVVGGCQFLRPDAPRVTCNGVPAEQCAQHAASWPDGSMIGDEAVVGVIVTCVSSSCTADGGEVQVSVRLGSGEVRDVGGGGWSGAGSAEPPEPAQPLPEDLTLTCLDVPRSVCETQARNAISGLAEGSGPVIGITVRCLVDACTERKGEGETRVTLGGAPAVTMNWAYESLESP